MPTGKHCNGSACRTTNTGADAGAFPTIVNPPYGGASGSSSCGRTHFLPSLTVRLDSALLPFHRIRPPARNVLHRTGQQHSVAVRIDKTCEMHQHFGASVHPAATLDAANPALNISTGRNEHAILDYERKRSRGIDRITFPSCLSRDGLFECQRNLGAGGDSKRIGHLSLIRGGV